MVSRKDIIAESLRTQHEAIIEAEKDEPTSDSPNRTTRIEGFYIGDFTLKIYENLRFYKRKNGKIVSIYVNQKGKGMQGPTRKYIEQVNDKLDHMNYTVEQSVIDHWKTHIAYQIRKNSRETLASLRKEKERQ